MRGGCSGGPLLSLLLRLSHVEVAIGISIGIALSFGSVALALVLAQHVLVRHIVQIARKPVHTTGTAATARPGRGSGRRGSGRSSGSRSRSGSSLVLAPDGGPVLAIQIIIVRIRIRKRQPLLTARRCLLFPLQLIVEAARSK